MDSRHILAGEGGSMESPSTTSNVNGNQKVDLALTLEGSSPMNNTPVESVANLSSTSSSQLNLQMRSPTDNALGNIFPNVSFSNSKLVVDPSVSVTDCSLLRNVGDVPRTEDFLSTVPQSNSLPRDEFSDFDLLTQNVITSYTF